MKAVAEVTTREAAQVAVEAIMIVDHMTEVAIVTAMIRVAVAVEVCTSPLQWGNPPWSQALARAFYMGELRKNTTSTGTITKKTW